MKSQRMAAVLAVAALAVLAGVACFACAPDDVVAETYEYEYDGTTYSSTYTVSGTTIADADDDIVVAYIPADITAISANAFANCGSLAVVIFEEDSQLASVGNYAFAYCTSLTSIELPEKVTSVGTYAFAYCTSLASADLGSAASVSNYTFYYDSSLTAVSAAEAATVGTGAFQYCESLTTFDLSGVTSVGSNAFQYCYALEEVDLSSATTIGSSAFSYCTALAGVEADAVTSLGANAFEYCSSLVAASLASVASVPQYAFLSCTALEEASLASATSIGNYAFRYCSALTAVYGDSIATVSTRSFESCSSLTTIDVGSATSIGNYAFCGCESLTAIDAGSATSVGNYAFYGCTSLAEADAGSAASIGTYAFEYCESLASVAAGSCATVGTYAFAYCTSLAEVELGACTSLGAYAFAYCTSLASAAVASISTVPEGAFYGCAALEAVDISSATAVSDYAFCGCESLAMGEDALSAVTTFGEGSFQGCASLTALALSSSESIGHKAFSGCAALASVSLKDGTSVYYDSFDDWGVVESDLAVSSFEYGGETYSYLCRGTEIAAADLAMVYIQIPSTVTSIGDEAFSGATLLATVEFEDESACASIGDYAFYGCTSLEAVYLPSSVASIGDYAFCGCTSLENLGETSSVTDVGVSAFRNCASLESLDLSGAGAVSAYALYGCTSLTAIDISSATSLGNYAFYGCASLASISLPEAVTSVPNYAFYGCSSLAQINLGGVATIGTYVFYGCESLTELDAGSATSIGTYAFYGCSSLAGIDVSSATSLGNYVFYGCVSLETVEFCSSLKSIGTSAFYGCTSLATITTGTLKTVGSSAFYCCSSLEGIGLGSVTTINDNTFYQCTSLTEADLGSATAIGRYAFYGCTSLESVTFCSKLKTINTEAFYWCDALESIEISTSVALTVGDYSFEYCTSLASVSIASTSTVTVNEYAFAYDTSLCDIALSGSSVSLLSHSFAEAFYDGGVANTALDLSGVTSIGTCAFQDCIYLTEVALSTSLSSLSVDAFDGCVRLTGFTMDGTGSSYSVYEGLVLSADGTELALVPTGITYLEVPSTVETMDYSMLLVAESLAYAGVEDGSASYVSLDGVLAEAGDGVCTVVYIPVTLASVDIDCDCDLALADGVLEVSNVSYLYVTCAGFAAGADAFTGRTLKVLSIASDGDVSIGGSVAAYDVEIHAYGSVSITGGSLKKAESFEVISYGDVSISDTFLAASTLDYLAVIADGDLSGTAVAEGGVSDGGTVVLGWGAADGASIAALDATYYMGDGCAADGVSSHLTFILIDYFTILLQVPVDGTDAEYYVVSSLTIESIELATVEADGASCEVIVITTSDGHQTWDVSVEVYADGVWAEIEADGTGAGYPTESFGDTVILRVSELSASADDDYVQVSFDTGYSKSVASLYVVYGRSVLNSQLPDLDRDGYTLVGWYIVADGELVPYGHEQITEATTLYALWAADDDYVELESAGGYYVDADGNVVEGLPLSDAVGNTYYYVTYTGFTVTAVTVQSTDYVEYDTGFTDGVAYVTIVGGSGYVTVSVTVMYASSSDDLTCLVEVPSVTSDDDVEVLWTIQFDDYVGTPLILGDYLYMYVTDTIYKIDTATGEVVATAESATANTLYYWYVGYGGEGDTWYILDYYTGAILDTDLNPVTNSDGVAVYMPEDMMYASWYDGYFYTVYDGQLWKFSPAVTDEDGTVTNLLADSDGDAYDAPYIFTMYGFTSSVVFVDGYMYWLRGDSSDDDDRAICAANLETGEVVTLELEHLYGYYWDDGWLTYYNGCLYLTAYTTGQFTVGLSTPSILTWVSVDGTEFGDVNYQYVYNTDGTDLHGAISGLIIQNGRGYINASAGLASDTGYLLVYEIADDGTPVLVADLETCYGHGGIVVSTAYLSGSGDSLNGTVYIYIVSYAGSDLYIVADTCTDGEWSLSDTIAVFDVGTDYDSQAVRIDSEGRLYYTDDTGALYCVIVAGSEYDPYTFVIEDDDGYLVVSGDWSSSIAATAIAEAFEDATGFSVEYDADAGTFTYLGFTLYAYCYEDGELVPLVNCTDLSSVRTIVLLQESYTEVAEGLDTAVYTTPSTASGYSDESVPITSGGEEISSAELSVGGTLSLASVDGAVWTSTDASVAAVSDDGTVTAVAAGCATVTATYTDGEGNVYRSTVVVSVTSATLEDAVANAEYYAGTYFTKDEPALVSFVSDDGTVVRVAVSTEGGEIVVVATVDGDDLDAYGWTDGSGVYALGSTYAVSGSAELSVYWYATAVEITDSSGEAVDGVSLYPYETETVYAAVSPDDSSQEVVWSSSDESVATVDEDGTITAVGVGTATVTATAADGGGASATVTVTVEAPTYTIAYDSNGGTGSTDSVTALYTDEVTLSDGSGLSMDGYNFAGWNTEADGSGTSYSAGDVVSGLTLENGATVTLYAQWEGALTVTVVVSAGGSETVYATVNVPTGSVLTTDGETVTITYDGEVLYTATVSVESTDAYTYQISSWSISAETLSADTTVTATYSATVNSYTVTVAVDGDGSVDVDEVEAEYGAEIAVVDGVLYVGGTPVTATAAEADGDTCYYSVSWSYDSEAVAGDMTVTATFTAVGHNYVAAVTDPTCTEQGYTTYTCSVCGDSYVDDYTDATGHDYELVDGSYVCSVCGDSYEATDDETGDDETGDADDSGNDSSGTSSGESDDSDDDSGSLLIIAAVIVVLVVVIAAAALYYKKR